MATITGRYGGSLKEIFYNGLVDVKAAANYLTGELAHGKDIETVEANNRGFRWAVDPSENFSLAFTDPDGGTMARPDSPSLNNVTANLQYLQVAGDTSNLQLANSAAGMHVGPSAVELNFSKMIKRRAMIDEYYFCMGPSNGKQTIAYPTTNVATTLNTPGVLTCDGSGDGLGGRLLGPNQYVRFYDSSFTFKHSGVITGKTSNSVLEYTPDSITTSGILTTDFILPQGTTLNAPKSLRYLLNATGTMFNQQNMLGLAATIDSTTTTISRINLEALWRNSKVRRGGTANAKQLCVVSEAQDSNYHTQFFAQNAGQVNYIGTDRPGIDIGGNQLGAYTLWGQKIKSYPFIHPSNWFMLDMSTFRYMSLKVPGPALTPGGKPIMKIVGGEYANAQVQYDDDYRENVCLNPSANAAMTSLAFSGLPGLLVNSKDTGANNGTQI